MKKYKLLDIKGREILDSRGNPTVEAKVNINAKIGIAKAPSGASTGKYEAVELRDGDKNRYQGKGVLKAVQNINEDIRNEILNIEFDSLKQLDELLINLDGTKNKSKLGANATVSVSMAGIKAIAKAENKNLFEVLKENDKYYIPVPMMNILNGGAHADNNVDIQEFMIMPIGANSFKEALRWCVEVYHNLKTILKSKGLSTGVGDEGGFAPNLNSDEEALNLILEAIEKAGYKIEEDFVLALDSAASEWWDGEKYIMTKSKKEFKSDELINFWEDLINKYPIYSLEDGFSEDDWYGFKEFTKRNGNKIQIVGDDLFVTNLEKLERGLEEKAANSILIKLNQIGTVSETIKVIEKAKENGWTAVVSHRSGETADTTISDLAVGLNTKQIKTGAPTRSDRVEKYNRLLEIEEYLGERAIYPGKKCFKFEKIENN